VRRIVLGTAVMLCITVQGDPAGPRMVEGVVIEIVGKGRLPRTLRGTRAARAQATRYVVQCAGWRCLLRGCRLVVVSR
jgi:hypothetical protein